MNPNESEKKVTLADPLPDRRDVVKMAIATAAGAAVVGVAGSEEAVALGTTKDEAVIGALGEQIKKSDYNVVCIPAGFPGAEEVRKNIGQFLKKNSSKVAHLIMLIHE